jgi:hypothetical protein
VLPRKKKAKRARIMPKILRVTWTGAGIRKYSLFCVDEDSSAFNKIAREIEDAFDWMRNDGVSPDDADSLRVFSKIESIPDPVEHPKSERRTLMMYYHGRSGLDGKRWSFSC